MSKREKMERKEIYQQRKEEFPKIARKLLVSKKEAVLKTMDGEEIKGFIRPLGGGELAKAFQAAGAELSEFQVGKPMTWAKLLAQNEVISRAFTATDGRWFSTEELDKMLPFSAFATGEVSVLAAEIFEISGLTESEAKASTLMPSETEHPDETQIPLGSFREKQT
jgi:hypothetical protein